MKIAFIGTHGVGKTTLCFDLAARLKRRDFTLDLVKEVARDCPLPINQDTTYDAQAWILHTQIARELDAGAHNDVVIFDRSVLDNYAYLVHRIGRRSELEPLIRWWMKSYTLLVKVPIWQPLRADGVRAVAESFQRGIDATIEDLLGDFRVKLLTLAPEDQPRWPELVLDRLDLPPRAEQETLFPDREA